MSQFTFSFANSESEDEADEMKDDTLEDATEQQDPKSTPDGKTGYVQPLEHSMAEIVCVFLVSISKHYNKRPALFIKG
jgi:hypothetical protein